MFFCSEIFDRNRGFDENFFLYFEETDYCFRSNKNDYKIYQINSQREYIMILALLLKLKVKMKPLNLKTFIYGISYGQNFIIVKNVIHFQ